MLRFGDLDTTSLLIAEGPDGEELELTAVIDGGPVGERRLFTITMTDSSGRIFAARFSVRNHYIGMVQKALTRIIPETVTKRSGRVDAIDP